MALCMPDPGAPLHTPIPRVSLKYVLRTTLTTSLSMMIKCHAYTLACFHQLKGWHHPILSWNANTAEDMQLT